MVWEVVDIRKTLFFFVNYGPQEKDGGKGVAFTCMPLGSYIDPKTSALTGAYVQAQALTCADVPDGSQMLTGPSGLENPDRQRTPSFL